MGGNININAPIVVGIKNSDIIANAVKGRGGNIQIETNALLGLQYRLVLTLNNDITRSAKFGLNGTIHINMLNLDSSFSKKTIEEVRSSQRGFKSSNYIPPNPGIFNPPVSSSILPRMTSVDLV